MDMVGQEDIPAHGHMMIHGFPAKSLEGFMDYRTRQDVPAGWVLNVTK
jgi:hypothetical protein